MVIIVSALSPEIGGCGESSTSRHFGEHDDNSREIPPWTAPKFEDAATTRACRETDAEANKPTTALDKWDALAHLGTISGQQLTVVQEADLEAVSTSKGARSGTVCATRFGGQRLPWNRQRPLPTGRDQRIAK
jgi:hypothetical protein